MSSLADASLDLVGLGKKKSKKAPVVPIADEELIEENRRKARSRRERTGRSSTILSDGLG